jgi:hypothetical protein
MRFRIYATLIAMALAAIWIAAQPAAAAECGAANQPPCPIKRTKPAAQKPTPPQRAAATPSRDPMQDNPVSPPASTEAVDIMLTKVPDIIVAEPNGHAQPSDAWREGKTTTEETPSPPPPPDQQQSPQMRRHGPED